MHLMCHRLIQITDKVLLKVAGVVAFVLGIILCVTIIGAIVGVPSIIGGKKLMDLSNSSDSEILANKDTILIWSIVLLFLCTISGILALIFYIQMEQIVSANKEAKVSKEENNSSDKEIEKRLENLKSLYDEKLITKEEYDAKRKKILGL